jgi:formate-dependent nitrite reductase membrane component NrfD
LTDARGGEASGRPASATRDPEDTRSYYGQPVIKDPVWAPEIPWYFFFGGLGGASAGLAYLSGLRGAQTLARRAWMVALGALSISPVLLIKDLGRPERFLNMLRMFKVTSPMSVGSWVLAASGATTGLAALNVMTGRLRRLARVGRPAAAALGLPLSTYTGALLAQTAVPVWHEARRELPPLFAAGAAVSAGAAGTVLTPLASARPARRLALLGAACELMIVPVMEHRLGELAEPYRKGPAGRYSQAARGLTAAGAMLLATRAKRSRAEAVTAGTLLLAGAVCERWSVFKAGFQSASDPKYTIGPQRARVAEGRSPGGAGRPVRSSPGA